MTNVIRLSFLIYTTYTCFFLFDSLVNSQEERKNKNARGGGRRQPRKGRGGKDIARALTINYPLHFFESNAKEWRTKGAQYSEEFVKKHESSKDWVDYARAQDQEDIWLYENWFYGRTNGIVIESGALDGELFSMSSLFEKFANWTAIHVEADPENYSNLKRNRQRAVNVHGALCSEPRLLHYSSEGVIPVRGFIEFMSPSFIKKWHGKVYNNKTKISDLPTVQCLPMKFLLRELNIKHVDLWVLDVEGAEESVLTGTDFESVHISTVAMECDEHDVDKNNRKMKILENHNFICSVVDRNCMCKNKLFVASESPSKTRLKRWDGNKWV